MLTQLSQYLARGVRQRLLAHGGFVLTRWQQPRRVFTQENREGRYARRAHASRFLALERRMRREPGPRDFARQTELIEQAGRIMRDTPGQNLRLTGSGGNFVSLKLANDV